MARLETVAKIGDPWQKLEIMAKIGDWWRKLDIVVKIGDRWRKLETMESAKHYTDETCGSFYPKILVHT